MDRARTGWIPKRALTMTLGLIFVAALCLGLVAVGAGAQGEPPEKLTEKELLSRLTAAPENAPDFLATATAQQTLATAGRAAREAHRERAPLPPTRRPRERPRFPRDRDRRADARTRRPPRRLRRRRHRRLRPAYRPRLARPARPPPRRAAGRER